MEGFPRYFESPRYRSQHVVNQEFYRIMGTSFSVVEATICEDALSKFDEFVPSKPFDWKTLADYDDWFQ